MGEGFAFYLTEKTPHSSQSNLIARVTPHALGYGYKMGEFIGTPTGDAVLRMLNECFRPDPSVLEWIILGEYGAPEGVEDLDDMGYWKNVREEAKLRGILGDVEMFDVIAQQLDQATATVSFLEEMD